MQNHAVRSNGTISGNDNMGEGEGERVPSEWLQIGDDSHSQNGINISMLRLETMEISSPYMSTSSAAVEAGPGPLERASSSSSASSPPHHRRPYDDKRDAGPAADPLEFPAANIARGRRADVLCYNQTTRGHDVAKDVLFRDYARDIGDADDRALHHVTRAYWPVPYKNPIPTIMGHVSICIVLARCSSEEDSSDDDGDSSQESDIVFQVTNQYVAIKVNYFQRMERLQNQHAEDPRKEVAAMQLVGNDHPNVLGCIEVLFDGSNLNLVLPYCGSGDLFQHLQVSQQSGDMPGFSESQAQISFRQVMDGLQHLHRKGICHRDLSPENIMMNDKGCLIIDLGMCLRVPYTDPQHPTTGVTDISNGTQQRLLKPQGACGKLPYMSPEIYRNRDDFDGEAVDVWTAGTILFCMLTGNRSYKRPHVTDPQYYWMTHGLPMLIDNWGVTLSDEAVDLLQNMLQEDPRLRLTIDEVISHPWFSHAT